jgi:O-antigen/teichoic acid export membrane protein
MTNQFRQKATESFIWDFGGLIIKQGIFFGVSIILARLLTPADFGLVAMAMVFIAISEIFADFGLSSALIQNQDNTSRTYSTVFYFNLSIGVLLFVILWLAAPLLAEFYNHPDIVSLVRWLALSFIITGFNLVQHALLRKNIEFKKISRLAVLAHAASGIIAVVMAINGLGVYALVTQKLLGNAFGTVLLWVVSPWRPTAEFAWTELRKLRGFSMYILLSYIATRIVTQLENLVVGKVFSASTLGLFNRAGSLNTMVTSLSSSSISRVSFSLFSGLQHDPPRFISLYTKLLEVICFAVFVVSGFLFFSGHNIIVLLYGRQWLEAVPIFEILVLKSFTYPVSLLMLSVFWGAGKSKQSFWFGMVSHGLNTLTWVVAALYGLWPFLYALLTTALINWLLFTGFVARHFPVSVMVQVRITGQYILLAGLAGAVVYWLYHVTGFTFAFSGVLTGLLFAGIYIAANFMLRTNGLMYANEYLTPAVSRLLKRIKNNFNKT